MTAEYSKKIRLMRDNGAGYGTIAKTLGISENTVKSYCRRNCLSASGAMTGSGQAMNSDSTHFCKNCGISVPQNPGRKEKKFCSDRCRNKWWNAHLDLVDRRSVHEIECANCGKVFLVYGSVSRKYCCHECYVEHRFGGGGNE